MSQSNVLGLDYGDRDLYAVYLSGEQFDGLLEPGATRGPPIYFDPVASVSPLGVGFPSVTRSIGNGMSLSVANAVVTADELVENSLAGLYKGLWGLSGSPGHVALAVPGAFGESRRRLLLQIAQRVGFAVAALIDRCAAAALGYRGIDDGKAKPTTLLVYHCDYSDCEFAIVRLARGRCRILAAGVESGLSSERFDALAVEEIVLGLREQGIVLGLRSYTGGQWLELRRRAEQARLALTRREKAIVELPASLTLSEGGLRLELRRAELYERAEPLVRKSLDAVESHLENGGLAIQSIDSVLTTGEVAINTPVLELLAERFGKVPIKGGRDLIARGAAIYAQELALGGDQVDDLMPTAAAEAVDSVSPAEPAKPGVQVPPRRRAVSVLDIGSPRQSSAPGGEIVEGDAWLNPIRDLIEQGRNDEAATLIGNCEEQLQALRERLGSTRSTSGEELVKAADTMLASGRYAEAVALAHQAYQSVPASAKIFADMIRIHNEAGLALNRMDQFADAMDILRCAHRHDQTDRSVHRALSERLYAHAQALKDHGDPDQARKYVEEALIFAPNKKEAQDLLRELTV